LLKRKMHSDAGNSQLARLLRCPFTNVPCSR